MKNIAKQPIHAGDVALVLVLAGCLLGATRCSSSSRSGGPPPADDGGSCIPAASGPPWAPLCVPEGSEPCCPGTSCRPVPGAFACLPVDAGGVP